MTAELSRGHGRKVFPYPQLGGLAVCAVAIVCLHHWLPPTITHGVLRGAYGAELLFALAGFFTTRLALAGRQAHAAGNISAHTVLRNSYAQGALRFLPVYVAVLLPILFLSRGDNDVQLALWSFTYNIHAAMRGELTGTLAHLWAPSIAFQFFVLWMPCALFLARRHLLPAAAMLVAMGILTRLLLATGEAPSVVLRCAAVTSLDALGCGALVALLAERSGAQRLAQNRWTRLALACGIPWVLWGMALQYDRMGAERALWETMVITTKAPLTFAFLALAAAGLPGLPGRLLASRPCAYLAQATVATYLLHAFVPLLVRPLNLAILPFGVLLLAVLTVGLGLASRFLYEVWFLRLTKRFPLPVESLLCEGQERSAA